MMMMTGLREKENVGNGKEGLGVFSSFQLLHDAYVYKAMNDRDG